MTQFAFKRTGDADYPRYLKILLQGPPKSGKTTFISTAPNVVVAAVEAGLMSIAHKDIPYIEVDATEKLQTLQMVLNDPSMRAQAAKNLGLPKIETVAIDTLDAWQEMLKREIMKENRRTQMQRDDWGTLKERMAAIMKAFVALPVNVIFTVHTTTSQDDEGRLIFTPNLQGSIKDDVAGYVDFSLLAYRQRDVDSQGVARINYYLKNEGDLKNPTLGNRAAGRVPEVCEPIFKTLHDAVFKGIRRADPTQAPTEITADPANPVPMPIAAPEPSAALGAAMPGANPRPGTEAAQAKRADAAQNLSTEVPAPAPTGVPPVDPEQPINAGGLSMLTKEYLAQGLVLPTDVETWTLSKARLVARWFVAWKSDKATGKDATREDLIAYLEAVEAYAGEIPGVQTGVSNVATPPKPSETPKSEVKASPSASEETPTPKTPATPNPATPVVSEAATPDEAQAVALLEDKLGAVQIGRQVSPDATCEVCGKQIDDVDIANLGQTRFKKILCVQDYKEFGKVKV